MPMPTSTPTPILQPILTPKPMPTGFPPKTICPIHLRHNNISILWLKYKHWNYNTPPLSYPGQISMSNWQSLPISIPKADLYYINALIASLVKIHWYLLKLSSVNKNLDLLQADNSVKNWRNLHINNPKTTSPHYQCTNQVCWKSTDFYSNYHSKMKIWTCLGQTTHKICPLAIPN